MLLILIILLPFIFRLSYYCLHYFFYARAPFSLHTQSLGRFWRPWIRTSRVLDIFLYCSGFIELVRVTRSWSLSFLDYRYTCYFIHVILSISHTIVISLLYSSAIIVLDIYVILQWHWFIVVDFITCSGYFRLSVCAWGIFLAYIRHQLSSRLRFHVFWEAGVTILLSYGQASE